MLDPRPRRACYGSDAAVALVSAYVLPRVQGDRAQVPA